MKRLIVAVIASGTLTVIGCSGGGYGTVGPVNTNSFNGNPGGSTPPPTQTSSTALFNLSSGQLPYPTDLYFAGSTDGTLNIQPANPLMPNQAAINALDGFSTTAVIREQFGGALNPASFTATSIIIVPVLTSNENKAPVGFPGPTPQPLKLGTDFTAALATDAGVGPQILEITPLHPLTPSTCISNGASLLPNNCTTGSGYLVILTNGITDAAGNAAVPDTDYATIKQALAGGPTCPSITDKTLNGVCQLTGAQLQIAQALGINPANIVLTFSFTTESTYDSLELLSATTKPQTLQLNATGLPTTAANKALPGYADILVGALTIPYYLSKSAPLTGSWTAPPFPLDPSSTFVTRFNPLPVATQPLLIPVLATVPNSTSPYVIACTAAKNCPTTWPVVIFQHGITRNREDMFGVADSFAAQGFAVVAIDLPLHGVTNTQDPLYASAANPLYAGLGLPTGQMSIERTFDLELITPGTIDPSGSHFINLTSLLTSRDNNREGAADLITFERSLNGATIVNIGGVPIFAAAPSQPSHYLGHSLGAIVGGVFMGVVPATDVSTGTLANPGGKLSTLLINSPSFAPEINAGLEAQGLTPGTTLYAQFFRDSQTVIDAGDPINYISLATAQHPIHLLQVVGSTPPPASCTPSSPANGCPDQVVPNSATQALITASPYGPAGAAGALTRIPAPAAPGPLLNPNGFRAYVNFIEGDHGSIIDDVVPAVTAEMQGEAISFAASNGQEILISDPAVIQP
jgi:pimeloyl-ACP methyl ester carboxylesterase